MSTARPALGFRLTGHFTLLCAVFCAATPLAHAQLLFPAPRDLFDGYTEVTPSDLDLDGNVDLIVTRSGVEGILVRYGVGDGTFTDGVELNAGAVHSLVVADVNADGRPDLLSLEFSAASLIVFLGQAGGGFFELAPAPLAPNFPQELIVGDFDGDGTLDILYSVGHPTPGPGLVVALGNGDGAFDPGVLTAEPSLASDLEVGDLNGDGRDDVMFESDSTVKIALADPFGLLLPSTVVDDEIGSGSAMGDFDGDGDRDIVTADSGVGDTSQLFRNNGLGEFPIVDDLEPIYGPDFDAVDLDGDGALDLVHTTVYGTRSHLGDGSGSFTPGPTFFLDAVWLEYADLNNDGDLDLAAGGWHGVTIALSDGVGGHILPQLYDAPDGDIPSMTLGDVDSDGDLDVLAVQEDSDDVVILRGSGNALLPGFTLPTPAVPGDVAVADLDADGVNDLIVTGTVEHVVQVRLGLGAGEFTPPVEYAMGPGPIRVVITDVDADSVLDVVTVNGFSGDVSIRSGRGGGALGEESRWATTPNPVDLAVADVNGDVHVDLIVAGEFGLFVHYGYGDGTFASPLAPIVTPCTAVTAGDVDGDGTAEIFATVNGEVIELLTSTGLVGFTSANIPVEAEPGRTALADFDDDGITDLIVLHSSLEAVAVYRGTGPSSFGPAEAYLTHPGPSDLGVGDMNGDGTIDVVTSRDYFSGSQNFSLLLNRAALPTFLRGDANQDGALDISDAISVLEGLFGLPPATTTCVDARDANDDGGVDIADVQFVLNVIFVSGSPSPPPPYPQCGADPTTDDILGCLGHGACL